MKAIRHRSDVWSESTAASDMGWRVRPLVLLMTIAMLDFASAQAADSLPLQRGYYVQSDTPCQRASNATITLYNGVSFGAAHAECRKPVIRKEADGTYQMTERCRDMQGNGGPWETFKSDYVLKSLTEFVETTAYGTFSFRYCKQSDLPEPWSTNDLSALGIR
jgi:hypothetical protein